MTLRLIIALPLLAFLFVVAVVELSILLFGHGATAFALLLFAVAVIIGGRNAG